MPRVNEAFWGKWVRTKEPQKVVVRTYLSSKMAVFCPKTHFLSLKLSTREIF